MTSRRKRHAVGESMHVWVLETAFPLTCFKQAAKYMPPLHIRYIAALRARKISMNSAGLTNRAH